jgi:glutamine synthetase
MTVDLAEEAGKKGIRYFLISFTDLAGIMRSKLVPAAAIGGMQKTGAGFAGFATYLDMTPADPDMFAVPDPATLIQLPWKKEIGWLASDLVMGGAPIGHAPRHVLRDIRGTAFKEGYVFKTGVECEFYLLDPAGNGPADGYDTQAKPCYDQHALLRRYDLISELCDYMQELGWKPYQNDHEDGNGQFEMNWSYADCLVTADRHAFFKFMARTLAEKHGLRASFMPKPFAGLTGSGCHAHFSLWDNSGKTNLFSDASGDMGLSALAYHFLGGVLGEASALCAISNPTFNSYKRINAPVTVSGATWSPNTISYTGNNRTHMVRIPDNDRFEFRLPDGAANPYLLPAALLAAGIAGVKGKADPGKRLDINMYEAAPAKTKRLPQTLHDALGKLDQSKTLRSMLGDAFIDSYLKLKQAEWNRSLAQVSSWERDMYLDV